MNQIFEYNFEKYLNCLRKCYSVEVQKELPQVKDFSKNFEDLFVQKRFDEILKYGQEDSNSFVTSICNRIVGVYNIQNSRRNNTELDTDVTFELISNSILNIPSISTISSVGSQGFLSIPLFKSDDDMDNFEFIRFHIWSPKLEEYINPTTRDIFSIHSHSFNAQSWIIAGEIINQDFDIKRESAIPNSALFSIQYNKTLNEVNQHQSTAVNTGQNIEVKEIEKSIFKRNDTYKIIKGNFHKSTQNNIKKVSATFFSFHLNNEKLVQSEVTGPIDVQESKINRKMYIEPEDFIKEVAKLNQTV